MRHSIRVIQNLRRTRILTIPCAKITTKSTFSDTQLGAALSLEEVMATDRDAVESAADFFSPAESTEEAYAELQNGFLATLSEDDRIIFIMRENGKTQKEIAEALGYKTHSAVTKRLQAMREQFELYIKEQG